MGMSFACRFEEDMSHRLDVSVKRIVQQSKRTAAELQLHVDESSLLQTENKSLQEERKSLMQVRLSLVSQTHLQWYEQLLSRT